jgi:hypothetical protein
MHWITRNSLSKLGDRWLVPLLLTVAIAASLSTVIEILGLPGEFSFNRLLLLAFPIVLVLACLGLLVSVVRKPSLLKKWFSILQQKPGLDKKLNIILPILWLFFFIIAFLPFSVLGRWAAAYDRINGLLQLVFLLVTELWGLWLFLTRRPDDRQQDQDNQPLIAGAILAIGIIIICLVIILTGTGIGVGTQYWGKSGVPILHWQIGISWLVMMLWLGFEKTSPGKSLNWQKDLLVIGFLWALSFIVWQSIPIEVSRFNVATYPPNYASYPYSDAGDYALQAEAIKIGNGFPFGYIDKPLHLTFLAGLSWLAGSDFSRMILLQVGIFALFPGLIYLLVSRLVSRLSGLFCGLLIFFMQSNNLAVASRIQATNVKMTMSETLTGIMLVLFSLALIEWWKNKENRYWYPALAGSLLGLSALVRLNVLVSLPFILLVWLIGSGFKHKKSWKAVIVFLCFCFLMFVPWSIRNQIVYGDALRSFTSKTGGVVLKKRINPIAHLYPTAQPIQKSTPIPVENQPALQDEPTESASNGWQNLIQSMAQTGMHNLVTVALSLPATTTHFGLQDTIRQPYWDQEWDGTFFAGGQIVLAFSLLILIVGFILAWKRSGMISLVPLLVLLPYLMANTVALVSGGRYIVPVDWVLPVYFGIGITAITLWLFRPGAFGLNDEKAELINSSRHSIRTAAIPACVIFSFIISCIPSLLSLSIPPFFSQQTNSDVMNSILPGKEYLPESLTIEKLKTFALLEGASFKTGKSIFPRWMKSGESDTSGAGSAFSSLPFDHLSFSLISSDPYPTDVVLPINIPTEYLPNGTDVVVVGCKTESYIDAVLVIVKTAKPIVYFRPDITDLKCPLPLP